MKSLEEELVQLRELSHHPHQDDFAARAGLSRRGLDYVEKGQRLPSPSTLEKILTAARASPREAERLRRLRAQRQAAREGFSLAERDAQQLPRLVQRMVTEAVVYFRQRNVQVTTSDVRRLTSRLRVAAAEILEADRDDARPPNG